ncbi:MAG TPA: hypothetical protein PLC97_06585 [Myxococcota bacterium]|jgi:hypothetical protein|nr:hypothetical protein [Myxococcota bacterium]
MKKLLRYGSVLVLVMAFAACGSNGDDGDNQGGKDTNVADQGGKDTNVADQGGKDTNISDQGDNSGNQDTNGNGAANGCHLCLKVGDTFRFTKLDVKEPSEPAALPAFLNDIWGPDIYAYRLNVLLQFKEITPTDDGKLKAVITVGSAWHDKDPEDVLPVNGPDDGGATPTKFHFVEGATSEINVTIDENCVLTTDEPGYLAFHPGPEHFGLLCGAGDESLNLAKDTVPLSRLETEASIAQDCSSFTTGRLDGCIKVEAACQLCSFLLAPDYAKWQRDVDETSSGEVCTMDYCTLHCGEKNWANFGAFVAAVKVPKACDADMDGNMNAYRIGGDWSAVPVTFGQPN